MLIILCFLALILGMYLKISRNQNVSNFENTNYSLALKKNEKIADIQVIDNNRLLFVISDSINITGIVYDIKNNQVVSRIEK